MFDLNKRAYISTLGELRALLADLPDNTEISGAGASGAWLHYTNDEHIVCIDPESLYDCYEDYDDNSVEVAEKVQRKAHEERLHCGNCDTSTTANYQDGDELIADSVDYQEMWWDEDEYPTLEDFNAAMGTNFTLEDFHGNDYVVVGGFGEWEWAS